MNRKVSLAWFAPFIVAHILWVGCHALMNSTGRINAWEFGGYGMYTTIPSEVHYSLVMELPEGNRDPDFPGVQTLRWWLEAGGCMFMTNRRVRDVIADMERHGLGELDIRFEKIGFMDTKDSIGRIGMARLQATESRIDVEACGDRWSIIRPESSRP
ncbi:MAG: hypothetical protein OXH65_13580 [Paracoccaceae bacterium]|nr:hypothetical protein [Paracoccaceae bacterium]MDE2676127.1 hypothetical protein [Paracoccaceae bacterium]